MNKVKIIAELAQSYEGDKSLCKKYIDLAHKSGANIVKFQIFEPEELCTPEYKWYDLFKSLKMPQEKWLELIDYSHSLEIEFVADIFGASTLDWMLKSKIDGIKIHSTDLKNYRLLEKLVECKSAVYLSTGGSTIEEIKKAIKILANNTFVVLMSGFQAEPNYLIDIELDKIEYLAKEFELPVGYADHISPSNLDLAISLPAMAYLKGANYIEKHLTIERDFLQLEDSISALNPKEFKQMVDLIRSVEMFPKLNGSYKLSEREIGYRKMVKKVPVAMRTLKKGIELKEGDVNLLRVKNNPKEILDINEVLGRTLLQDLNKNEPFVRSLLK